MSRNKKANSNILPPMGTITPTYNNSVFTPTPPLVGQIISLNAKQGLTFAVGDIELTQRKYWATVSGGMNDTYYDIIRAGLDAGDIVLGKQLIPAVDKPAGVIDEYFASIKGGKTAKAVTKFKILVKRGSDRNYTVAEIATGCLKVERATKNREEIIKFLQEVLSFHEGQFSYLTPTDDEEGKIEVKIVDGIIQGKEGKEPPRPATVVPGAKSKDEALGELFS